MTASRFPLRLIAAAALVGVAGASQAAIVVSTNKTAFVAATSGTSATDSFGDLTINTYLGLLSTARNTQVGPGAYSYNVTSTNNSTDPVNLPSDLFVAPVAGTIALATAWYNDTLTFDSLGSIQAFGGSFFRTNVLGEAVVGNMTLVATNFGGDVVSFNFAGSASGFVGFLSDSAITSVVLSNNVPDTNTYASVDNLVLAAVPEASTWMMMLAGGAAVLRLAARRRA
jgi:hypothetical protein